MTRGRNLTYGILSCIAMLMIILDGKCAVWSAKNGLDLCLRSVIPALFPFFFLSGIMNSCFIGQSIPFTAPLRRLCRIPKGTESILFIGLISGYPVGAQLISDAYTKGTLTKENASRMLGFCSNAGPAFIFGMLTPTFSNPVIPWVLWGIHIISALVVGWILPVAITEECVLMDRKILSITKTLQNSIRNIATVCGWVILFRMVLDFCKKWFLQLLPVEIQVMLSGAVELTNGCVMLQQVETESMRFIIASGMLAFGGICVLMQTISVTGSLGIGFYFPGKLLQTLLSITLSFFVQLLLFHNDSAVHMPNGFVIVLLSIVTLAVYLLRRKKVVAFRRSMLYNSLKKCN